MQGVVERINQQRGMVAVLTEQGYSIFEVFELDMKIGDMVSWPGDTPTGSEIVINHTQGKRCEVIFRNHHVNPSQIRQQL